MAPEEATIQVTIRRGVSLGGGRDHYPGEQIEVTPSQATWLLEGADPFAVPGWEHPEARTEDQGLANREGTGGGKGKAK